MSRARCYTITIVPHWLTGGVTVELTAPSPEWTWFIAGCFWAGLAQLMLIGASLCAWLMGGGS